MKKTQTGRRISRRAFFGMAGGAGIAGGVAIAATNPTAIVALLDQERGGLGLTPEELIDLRGEPDPETGPNQLIFKPLLMTAYVARPVANTPIGMIALNFVPWTWSLDDARNRANAFIPSDARYLRSWKENWGDTTYLYNSHWLKERLSAIPSPNVTQGWWDDGEPGDLVITIGPELKWPHAVRTAMLFVGR
jgi:hypothetical protein